MTVNKKLGPWLKALRKRRGATQTDLGALLGVSKCYISMIENSRVNLSRGLLRAIDETLGPIPDRLLSARDRAVLWGPRTGKDKNEA